LVVPHALYGSAQGSKPFQRIAHSPDDPVAAFATHDRPAVERHTLRLS